MTHYTNTNNPIDFPKKKEIPMLERMAAQSLVEYEGELIFSKEKFAELIVRECMNLCIEVKKDLEVVPDKLEREATEMGVTFCYEAIKEHFGVEE